MSSAALSFCNIRQVDALELDHHSVTDACSSFFKTKTKPTRLGIAVKKNTHGSLTFSLSIAAPDSLSHYHSSPSLDQFRTALLLDSGCGSSCRASYFRMRSRGRCRVPSSRLLLRSRLCQCRGITETVQRSQPL